MKGGGDGTFGGMEARLGKLEAHMAQVQKDLTKLANVPADLASLKTQIGHLPSKDYLTEKLDRNLRNTGIVFAIVSAVFWVAIKLLA